MKIICQIILLMAFGVFPLLAASSMPSKQCLIEPLQPTKNTGENVTVLEIVDIKVGNESVTVGRPFTADNGWIRKLTVRLRNISDKPMTSVAMTFEMPEFTDNSVVLGFFLDTWMRQDKLLLMPNQIVDLTAKDLASTDHHSPILVSSAIGGCDKIRIGHTVIQFEDGKVEVSVYKTAKQ